MKKGDEKRKWLLKENVGFVGSLGKGSVMIALPFL
jgi:hypothetical protein